VTRKRLHFGGLWRHPDFMKLWIGETISSFGARISSVAIPLAAALTLQATAAQMGYLNAAQFMPFLMVTLFAGVWVDRRHRRPTMIATNLARAVLLAVIPVLAWLGWLSIGILCAVVFLIGLFQVLFELAYQAYLPSLVTREQLVEGNSKLQASSSAAQVGGPGLAGLLTGWFTAPVALLGNTCTYLVSALALTLIRKPEPPLAVAEVGRSLWRDIGDGFRVMWGNPYLRAVCGEAATYNLFGMAVITVYTLYATRDLGLSAGMYGLIFSIAGGGALLGALIAGWAAKRIGFGRAFFWGMVAACAAPLLIPIASGRSFLNVVILTVSFFINGMAETVTNVHGVVLRQSTTPGPLLGRMNASYRFVTSGTTPLGALLGGALGGLIGLRMTLLVSGIGLMLGLLWVAFSPVPRLAQVPAEPWGTDRAPRTL